MRFAFDLDGVICTQERDYAAARPRPEMIARIRALAAEGHEVVIYTGRGSETGENWSGVTIGQLHAWDVPCQELRFGKPGADVYVDDRAMAPAEALPFPHVTVVAEIGINHNGSLETALQLIEAAKDAGADFVKFQKREPHFAVPESQWAIPKETPWGRMTYLEYKTRMEFGEAEYDAIDRYCKERGIGWFASPWDLASVDFLDRYDLRMLKVASASITDEALLRRLAGAGKPIVISSGMSTLDEVRRAVEILADSVTTICHCNSTYPCPPEDLNLRCIGTLRRAFPNQAIGYSGHEVGLQTTLAAVAMGATYIERHITLDRAAWGTDQAASVEPQGFKRLVRDIRVIESAMGDGEKRVTAGELPVMAKLRKEVTV